MKKIRNLLIVAVFGVSLAVPITDTYATTPWKSSVNISNNGSVNKVNNKVGWVKESYYNTISLSTTEEWFYYNEDGTKKKGWFQDKDGKWYYLSASLDGAMVKLQLVGQYFLGMDGAWTTKGVYNVRINPKSQNADETYMADPTPEGGALSYIEGAGIVYDDITFKSAKAMTRRMIDELFLQGKIKKVGHNTEWMGKPIYADAWVFCDNNSTK
ncbi:hypothetical protein [Clostridium sp. C2-6-12]|uniref:hypothetical protein n=1 Tax=Clostridium sp. C2-6-12 TaxID=2698832 RepID=UPI00136BA37B|nr:hypothetical protein [Clostridium sp. C2-6-12]